MVVQSDNLTEPFEFEIDNPTFDLSAFVFMLNYKPHQYGWDSEGALEKEVDEDGIIHLTWHPSARFTHVAGYVSIQLMAVQADKVWHSNLATVSIRQDVTVGTPRGDVDTSSIIITLANHEARIEELEAEGGGGTRDYNDLTNKPSLNGNVLEGNVQLEASDIPTADGTVQSDLTNLKTRQDDFETDYRTSALQDEIDAIKRNKPTFETYTISTWTALFALVYSRVLLFALVSPCLSISFRSIFKTLS